MNANKNKIINMVFLQILPSMFIGFLGVINIINKETINGLIKVSLSILCLTILTTRIMTIRKKAKARKIRNSPNFINACIEKKAKPREINDYIEYWHTHNTNNSLREFLGMTVEEYDMYSKSKDGIVKSIVKSRVNNKKIL